MNGLKQIDLDIDHRHCSLSRDRCLQFDTVISLIKLFHWIIWLAAVYSSKNTVSSRAMHHWSSRRTLNNLQFMHMYCCHYIQSHMAQFTKLVSDASLLFFVQYLLIQWITTSIALIASQLLNSWMKHRTNCERKNRPKTLRRSRFFVYLFTTTNATAHKVNKRPPEILRLNFSDNIFCWRESKWK